MTVVLPPPPSVNAPQPVAPGLGLPARTPGSPPDVEAVRFALEHELARHLGSVPGFDAQRRAFVPTDPELVRRRLLAQALRLTPSMAPGAYERAARAQQSLGIVGTVELYQAGGRENAGIHLVEHPILLEIQGRLLTLLDDGAAVALFGHELGHYLAHGPWAEVGSVALAGATLAERGVLTTRDANVARRLVVAREVTADRFGLLACRDLEAALRLEMVATTGLPGEALTWDTKAYLQQCRELMEATLAKGEAAEATTHPEHSLRAWAVWLFSETDLYRKLTGQGPGTRKKEEIDALVARALGIPDMDLSVDVRDEPPAFLAECALAAAVLVAHADGEVAQEELDAIEDAFAHTVPGWSEFLDWEVALHQFHETSQMVRWGGPDLVRSLFLVLTHVMGADDVVDGREIEMILAIGESLGYLAEFRHWLQPTLSSMNAQVELDIGEPRPLPLPARRGEVKSALDALCEAVTRRGESRVSKRRLLRLAGASDVDAGALTKLNRAFAANQIDAEPSLDRAGLDDPILLVSTRWQTREDAPAPEPLDATRTGLLEALTRLRDKLISGDGRSPSIRIRSLRRGRVMDLSGLERVRPGGAERVLELVRIRKPAVLVTPQEAGTHDVARQCAEDLRHIERANRDRQEETGANDLYVGHPVVVGSVAPSGQAAGYAVRAPLVLYPVELVRDRRGARGFSLEPRSDEEPVVNQSLVRLLFNKMNLALPDDLGAELDDIAGDPTRGLEALLAKLAEVGVRIRVEGGALVPFRDRNADMEGPPMLVAEECALLGIFPQSSSDLLQDYDSLLRALGDGTVSERGALNAAVALLPDRDIEGGEKEVEVGWPVVPADPTQREVAEVCARNLVTVVDGPPGTGKSQLIVNLIADAMRKGQRVALVAEKRAALDVVRARLHGCGLGHAVAVVHDVNDDRTALYDAVRSRLEGSAPVTPPVERVGVLKGEHARACDVLEARDDLLRHVPEACELSLGRLFALAASGPETLGVGQLEELGRSALAQVLEVVERLHPHVDLWGPDSWWRTREGPTRASLVNQSDAGLAELRRDMREAEPKMERMEQRLAAAGVSEAALVRAARGLAALVNEVELWGTPEGTRMLRALMGRSGREVEDVARCWGERETALARWNAPIAGAVDEDLLRGVTVLESYAGRFGRLFSPTWWKVRGAVRRSLVSSWPEKAGAPLSRETLHEIRERVEATRAWREAERLYEVLGISDLSPRTAEEARGALDRLGRLARLSETLLAQQVELAGVGFEVAALGVEGEQARERLASLQGALEAREEARALPDAVVTVFPWLTLGGSRDLVETITHVERDGSRLREVDGWIQDLVSLYPDARELLDEIADELPEASAVEWREAMSRAWGRAHLARAQARFPQLEDLGLTAADHDAARARDTLRRSEQGIREAERQIIAAGLERRDLLLTPDAAFRARRTPLQKVKERVLKEVRKKSRRMPLRRFVREFSPQGLLDVLPCWLVSPETLTVLFPREPLFDLVVFDEASQCTVESGVPVMTRAQRVVVAGDEKQMPPTSFFKMRSDSTEDEDRTEAEMAARDVFAAESLLGLARMRCVHAGLKWHYRCQEEELIAFSNHALYDGELLTIPSVTGPEAEPALRWIEVEGAQYDAGVNRKEAERVVDLVEELLGRTPRPSVGVVTFNIQQRQTILDVIDARKEASAPFAERWHAAMGVEALDERPFVKNLESVQGDERDIIVFSVGHAPIERKRKGGATEMYVPARFGPLAEKGGERRLNVAISRAKAECYVVASFSPDLLHVANARNDGPLLFSGYLQFAHALGREDWVAARRLLAEVRGTTSSSPGRALDASVCDGHMPLPNQIALALEGDEVRCETWVGTSGFRIPLCVGRAGESRFRVAVLTNEGTGGEGVLERHVHWPAVLELRGWQVLHVSAATWARRPAEVVQEILRRVLGDPKAVPAPPRPRAAVAAAAAPQVPLASPQGSPGPATPRPATPPPVPAPPAQVPVGPAWLEALPDAGTRAVFLHLDLHGQITEAEVMRMLGSARKARRLARRLEDLSAKTPLRVAVQAEADKRYVVVERRA